MSHEIVSGEELAAERLAIPAAERWSTLSLLQKHTGGEGEAEAAEAVLRAASDYLYNLADWEGVDVLDALRRVVLGEEAEPARLYWVGVYLEDRAFGGREEGGWWYDCGTLQTAPWLYSELGFTPSSHTTLAAARAARDRFADGLAKLNSERRSDIGSVLSEGRFAALIFEDKLPEFYPEKRPHYE